MPYVPHIPRWFDVRRAAQVVAFFAIQSGGVINILRVTKLVYLADRLSMDKREYPITRDNFVSMPFGPVNSYTYSYMKGTVQDRAQDWAEFIAPERRHKIFLSKEIVEDDLDELSRSDLAVLHDTWNAYRHIGDQFDLAEFTHQYCPEWRDPDGSSVPIDFATVYKKLGKEDPIELAEQIQADRVLSASFNGR